MSNISNSFKSNYKYFSEFYEPKTSIYLVEFFALLVSLIGALLSLTIIWFEKSRSGYMNTLMDKLKVYFCWVTLLSAPIIKTLNILNYYFGPLNYSTCFFLNVFRNIFKSNMLFYFNCIAISRYILIFWMKIQLPSMKTSGPPWSAFWYPRCEIFEIFLSYIKSASSFIFMTISRKKRFDPHYCWPNQLTVL